MDYEGSMERQYRRLAEREKFVELEGV